MITTSNPASNSASNKAISTTISILVVAVVATLLLLIHYLASFITAEMEWTLSDYILVWVMLMVAGTTYTLVSRLSSDYTYRGAVALSAVTGLFLVWSNLAVGIIGNEDNAINSVYFIIIMVGFIGAFWVRFQSKGLSRVLGGMQLVHTAPATDAEAQATVCSALNHSTAGPTTPTSTSRAVCFGRSSRSTVTRSLGPIL